ncbi:MAG: ABC transporter permease [Huintestinicola sp.]
MSKFRQMLSKSFTPQESVSKKAYIIIAICSFFLIFLVWLMLTELGLVNEKFLPKPSATLQTGITLFTENGFIEDIGITTYRVLMGFVISAVVAIPLGILVGVYSPIEAIFEPVMSFVRYLPVTAFIPLFILWIGIDETEKIAVIILGSFPQLLLMIAGDTRKVKHDLVEVSYTLGTNKVNVVWKIIFPAAMPYILESLRMVLGWAWTYVTVAEMIAASSGIGYMILQSQRMLSVGKIFVGILTIGVIGLIFDFIFKGLSKKLFPWFSKG